MYLIEVNKGKGPEGLYICEKARGTSEHLKWPVSDVLQDAVKFHDEASAKSLMKVIGVTEKDFKVTPYHQAIDFKNAKILSEQPIEMIMTCPRRKSGSPSSDYWKKVGDDLCCSYCGSMQSDKVEEIAEAIAEGDFSKGLIEGTTKSYKVYITREEVKNASMGGIKFYVHHAPMDRADDFCAKINKAMELSMEKIKSEYPKFV